MNTAPRGISPRYLGQDVVLRRRPLVLGTPAPRELAAELRRVAADDLGRADHLVEEEDQGLAEVLLAVGEVGLHVVAAMVAEAAAFGDEEEEAHDPVGKRGAEEAAGSGS